jgi:uncharacterized PurR-regulated membrane protein YhhQ (DUF165 family)
MTTPTLTRRGVLTLAGYVATVAAANWAAQHYQSAPVGFGLTAPAGVYFAGLAFTLRDLGQELAGRVAVAAAIVAGALLSLAVSSPALALASALAFTVSETADWAVYEPLRRRRWLLAVAASNAVGLAVDSVLFLWLTFGFEDLPGQIVGKTWMTLAAVLLLVAVRRVVPGQSLNPEGA